MALKVTEITSACTHTQQIDPINKAFHAIPLTARTMTVDISGHNLAFAIPPSSGCYSYQIYITFSEEYDLTSAMLDPLYLTFFHSGDTSTSTLSGATIQFSGVTYSEYEAIKNGDANSIDIEARIIGEKNLKVGKGKNGSTYMPACYRVTPLPMPVYQSDGTIKTKLFLVGEKFSNTN